MKGITVVNLYIYDKNNSKWILNLLCIITLISAFPSTYLYYLAPIYILIYSIIYKRLIRLNKLLSVLFLFSIVTFVSLAVDFFKYGYVNLTGVFFALITYSSIIIFLSMYNSYPIDGKLQIKILKFISIFVIIQSLISFIQIIISDNWDAVSGTFGLFDFITGDITISQVMYTFNMFILFFYLLSYWRYAIVKTALLLGFLSVTLAQSGHQTIFFLLVLIIIYGSFSNFRTNISIFLVGIATMIFTLYNFFPNFFAVGLGWFNHLLNGNIPKVVVVRDSLNLLSDFKIFTIGTGIGQFSSRASLFSSGEYLSVNLPDIVKGTSYYYREYISPLLILQENIGQGSAIAKPYFSILSIIMELGVIVTSGIFIYLIKIIRANNKIKNGTKNKEVKMLVRFRNSAIFFFLLCCLIENYAEFVQALSIPVIVYFAAGSRINYLMEEYRFQIIE